MRRLDRLEWRSGLSFTAYGASIGIRTNDPDALAHAVTLVPPGAALSDEAVVESLFSLYIGSASVQPGRRNYHLLYLGSERIARTLDLDEIWRILENNLTIATAYFADPEYIFVHAGVVGWRGQAIVIPGRSRSGKSSLVDALVQAGAVYYSDEMAIVDADGLVSAYPVTLSLRTDDERTRVMRKTTSAKIELEALPIGLVVDTEYAPDALWRPHRISAGRTILALFDNAVAAKRIPQDILPTFVRAVSNSEAIRSKRGEADDIVPDILSYIGG